MAGSSATTNINANSGGKFYVAVSWSETGTSTSNNTSTISVTGTIGQRQSGEAFWSGNVKAGQLTIYWHDNNAGTDQWITNLNVWEIGYDQASRSVTGSVTVTHKSDGTLSGYAKATWVKDPAGVPYYAPNDGTAETGWVALTTIPRGSSGKFSKTAYTIGEEIKINFDRKSTSFTEAGYIQYPDRSGWIWAGEKYFSGAGDSWSWTPTQAEINMLYGQVPNAQSATMWADCKTLSGGTEINQFAVGPATMSVDPSVCSPLFSDFTYADTNATTTAITGNNSVMISGKSTLTATISAANKATPRLSATMDKYTFAVADLFTDESYSESAITKTLGSPTVANTELPSATRDLTVSAIDSRGISTTVTKAITIVPYQAPIVNATAKRVNGFENDTTVTINGTFSRIEVGGTAKNTVNSSTGVKYRYKAQSTSTWGSWTNKTATIDTATGSVSVANFTLNLDNQASYDIQVQITDKLETTIVSLVVSVGQPAFFIGADGRVSIGEMPQRTKEVGEKGLLEVGGRLFSGGNAYANGNRLAELPISRTDLDLATVGTKKYLDTIPYSSFTTAWSSTYKFDPRSYFCDGRNDRVRQFDFLIVTMDFVTDTTNDVYFRWGTPLTGTGSDGNATHRVMINIQSSSISAQIVDSTNLIFESANEFHEAVVLYPMQGDNTATDNVDNMFNVAVHRLYGTQANNNSVRLNLGSWVRISRLSEGKIPMWFDSAPFAGNMKVYGVKYPTSS